MFLKMKKIFIIMFLFLSFFWFTFWVQEDNIWTWGKIITWDKQDCSLFKDKFTIIWPKDVKVWYNSIFKIKGIEDIEDISWSILRNNKKVLSDKWKKFIYSFKSNWQVNIQVYFKYRNCDIKVIKNVNIYDKFIISLMKDEDVSFVSSLWTTKQHIYYKNFNLKDLFVNKYILNVSDYIIIDQTYITPFLLQLWDLKRNYNNKKFIFLVSSFKWFFSRIIIPYIKWLDKNNIYVYNKERFPEVFAKIYQWLQLNQKESLAMSNIWNKLYFPLSYCVNKLIENDFNIEILWVVLLTLLWTIIVAFFRQIIWFSVFWVYTPLILSILIITLWYKIVILLFFISIISSLITYFITKKVYILYSAKVSLNYIVYIILSIVFIWLFVNYIPFTLSKINFSVILPFFIMPMLTKNLIKEDTNIFSKQFIFFIAEFIFIVSVLLFIFKITLLKYILIAYPDILWILAITIVLIWRFTWLQLLEYIRFYPLIKKELYDEE